MYYETEGTETTSNSIQLKSRETTQGSRYQFVSQESGGNGNGDNRPTEPVTPEPQTPPTPEPTPGPQPQPTPQDSEPEPKSETAKPVKKAKKKAVLPATGDTQNVAVVAGIGVITIMAALVMSMPLRRD